ncbi:MAG TPA: glycoside hydrolase family 27 protein [Solirubrobacteraceae bacterium]|nr:glycoside hydrolase family 27 protein [Solirubrobacteraceae bacterium]
MGSIAGMRSLWIALATALVALAPSALFLSGVAAAAPSLGWSMPAVFDSGNAPSGVSCASESFCVAVDGGGNVLSTPDPTASHPSWSLVAKDEGKPLNGVSCAAGGPCVAVDDRGDALVGSGSSVSPWSPPAPIDGGSALTGVSCAGASLCVAVDAAGDVLSSPSPKTAGWSAASIDSGHRLTGVSCSSQTQCVAVDDAGDVLSSANPAGGGAAWHSQKVSSAQLVGVSCSATGSCLAIDSAGDAFASSDPSASDATWSETPIDGEALTAVSCPSSGLCVAADGRGQALASDDPAAPIPAWSVSSADSAGVVGISCLASGFCLAVDPGGSFVSARVPPPAVTTLAPTTVSDVGASLAGVVDPKDALLESCSFEYGSALPYTQSVPCSALPSAIGGAQSVSAQLAGLSPNTTYHYRVVASSRVGASAGADVTFATAVSSQVALVHPQPSITGTPAVGQRLTCHPGTPSGTTARLGYAWVRDLIPIPEATSTTYTVKGRDSSHHLQCQLTATDGGGSATEKSAFVTIPVGGAPASVGETAVGKASYKNGKLSVPIFCSAQASGGCEVTVRLAVVETLSGGRLVALAASSHNDARSSAAGLRHVAVTLASVRVRLAVGSHRTVIAELNTTARRLLASRRRFSAHIYVSGTVIGVIEARLAQQLITLGASAHAAFARAAALDASAQVASAHPLAPTRAGASRARAASVLAATPYMGWDTYFALGGNYSEATVLRQASELISLGLRQRGYRYVWLDVGWWHGTRAANGQITVSPKQWPHGLAWLTSTLHAAGLLVGLYTDAGSNGCGGAAQGSYGHYQQDVNTFAAWGFDAVKVDFCGGAEYGLNPVGAYAAFHAAIAANSSHRPMLLSICDFLQPEQYGDGLPALGESAFSSYSFGPSVGNSWRTDTDVGFPGNVPFADVLRNMDADAAAPQAAGPGHWNDPDYLAPDQGMSATQFRSQFSMWAMLAAPLMISDNLTKIGASSLAAVQNSEAIAIDQDPGGVQGTLLSTSGNGQVWVKPLIGGSRAVALLNRGPDPIRIATSASAIGLPASSGYSLRNVWAYSTSVTSGAIDIEVAGDSTVLLRVRSSARD